MWWMQNLPFHNNSFKIYFCTPDELERMAPIQHRMIFHIVQFWYFVQPIDNDILIII